MQFDWDEQKNITNVIKHGISFEQAITIFNGFTLSRVDDQYDYGENREITMGLLHGLAVVVVMHMDRNGICRIISARQADKRERKQYDQAIRQAFDP